MKKKIRWGILGAGKIADKFISDLTQVQTAEIVAIVSSNPDKAIRLSNKYQIEQIFTDYVSFAKSNEFDAVYVATAHTFHFEHSRLCLENGKAVLCEKPVTVNAKELILLQKLASEKGLLFMEALWSYFLPAFKKAKEWIDAGYIGDIEQINADFGFKAPFLPHERIYNPNLAGGALLDVGIYPIIFAMYFAGAELNRDISTLHIGETGVDEHNMVMLGFENNVFALLSSSIAYQMENDGIIYGSKGRIILLEFWKAKKAILETDSERLVFEDKRSTWGYNFEAEHFSQLLLGGITQSDVVSPQISLKHIQLMDRIRKDNQFVYPFE